MIANPEKVINKYKCKRHIAGFLIKNGLPLLSCEGEFYYFTKNEVLDKKLEKVPFYLKALDALR